MTDETKMSSEEKEQVLAQEALDATAGEETTTEETSPAEKPEGVPVAKHVAERHKLQAQVQEAQVATARAEGKLAALEQAQATQVPSPKSPFDVETERQVAEGTAEEDVAFSPRIFKAQEAYNQQVANQKAATAAEQQLRATQLTSANKAKAKYDDWQNIVLSANGLLTEGELLDIDKAGSDFGEVAYTKAKIALERNQSLTDTAPETKKGKSEAEAKAKAEAEAKAKEKVPTQQEILNLNVDPVTEAAAQL